MTMSQHEGRRLPWTTPTLKTIVAGAAEAANTTGSKNDGGKTANDKS